MPGKTALKKTQRIKSNWASLIAGKDGSFISTVKTNGTTRCLLFRSLDELSSALKDKTFSVRKWALAVPNGWCIFKKTTLPASDITEAARMIEFELESLVPLSREQIVYGCIPQGTDQNMLKVLVCILKHSTLEKLLEPCKKIGIEPFRISFDWLGLHYWFCCRKSGWSRNGTGLVLDENTSIVLTSAGGNFQSARELRHSDSNTPEVIQKVLNDAHSALKSSEDSSMLTIAAGKKNYPRLEKSIQTSTLKDRAHLLETPDVFNYATGTPVNGDGFDFAAAAAAGLMGLAESDTLPASNLLPARQLKRHRRKRLILNWSLSSAMVAGCLILLWLCLSAMSWRIAQACRPMEKQIASIRGAAKAVEGKRKRIKLIQNQLSKRGLLTQIFNELYRYTPGGISISKLAFTVGENETTLRINGQADKLSNAFGYAEAMQKASLLKSMQIENAQLVPRPGGSVVEFKAHCDFRKDSSK